MPPALNLNGMAASLTDMPSNTCPYTYVEVVKFRHNGHENNLAESKCGAALFRPFSAFSPQNVVDSDPTIYSVKRTLIRYTFECGTMSFYDEIEIEDMTYHESTTLYTYPCPCGDQFEILLADLRDGEEVAVCPSCSLMIKVIFEAVRRNSWYLVSG